jgi:tetratricopeptide (TPR) repeat protein
MYLESEYPNTEELLGKFAHAKPSGESEFYRAAMLYRMGEFEKSKSAIDRSLDKEFYMASIFAGIAYQLGLEGYSKDNVESQSYFRKFESWKKHCNEEYISDSNFELAYETVAKVFGLAHTSLVLPAPLNQ